jgi:hypothetical protein
MSLLNTPVVPASVDAFWQDPADLPAGPLRLLVLTLPWEGNGSSEEQTLMRMLAACRLEPGSFAIYHCDATRSLAWHKIREHCRPAALLLLGILPHQLGVSALFRPHEVNAFDGVSWIPTASLIELQQREELRKALWTNTLKPYFGIQ